MVVPLALFSDSLTWTWSSFWLNQCLTASVLRPSPPPPILLPHLLLQLFYRSATAAPPSANSMTTPFFYPLSKISPKPFPTYFPMCVLSLLTRSCSPPDPLNI